MILDFDSHSKELNFNNILGNLVELIVTKWKRNCVCIYIYIYVCVCVRARVCAVV